MKTNWLSIIVPLFCISFLSAYASASGVSLIENSTWQNNLTPVRFSATAWGDVDNDGDLDLALSGCLSGAGGQDCDNGVISKIYTNNGTSLNENNTWSQNLTGVGHGSNAWGDVDNDGDLDLVITGCTNATSAGGCIGNIVVHVYVNNGSCLLENSTWSNNLTAIYYGNLALSDINNDGRIDISLLGSSSIGKVSKIYINNGASFVENSTWESNLTELNWGALSFADINNDGYMDLAMTGRDVSSVKTTKVYINNGTSFVENSTWEMNLIQCDESGLIFGDYDNDNDMDMVIMGCCDHLFTYKNNGTTFVKSQNNSGNGGDLGGGLFDGSIAFGDYNNDGNLDFVGIGREEDRNEVYQNNESRNYLFETDMTAGTGIIADNMRHGALAWADLDKDFDLDLITTGSNTSIGIMARIYINNNSVSNVQPASPTSNMNSTFNFSTGKLALSWGNGSDTETPTLGLYYNLRVGTCSDCHDVVTGVYGGSSGGEYRGGGPASGYFGNMMQRKRIVLNRPDLENKTIYWAVQTIDTGLAKSNWSTEQVFEITQACTENWTYGEWSSCVNNQQTRTATDLNDCGTTINKSATVQSCTSYSPPSGGGTYVPPATKKNETNGTNTSNTGGGFDSKNTSNASGNISAGANTGSEIEGGNQSAQICVAFDVRCEGNNLMECNVSGAEWAVKQICEFGCADGECKERPSEAFNFLWIVLPAIVIVAGATSVYFLKIRK
jgi:hypothetical protein